MLEEITQIFQAHSQAVVAADGEVLALMEAAPLLALEALVMTQADLLALLNFLLAVVVAGEERLAERLALAVLGWVETGPMMPLLVQVE